MLLLPAGLSWAQSAPAPAQPPLATRAEYTACLDKADELAASRKALQARKTEHEAAVNQLQEDVSAHVQAGIALDVKKKGALEGYNNNGAMLNARRDKLNASADQFAKDVAEHNRLGAESGKQCTGMKIATEDRQAVEKDRAARTPK
ncbi:hypothetical protein BWI17_12270 [Betaproteobacteria bacterium GR16-43]|nr:hypothetical protein BWI17_12270 [Betaproteobacteria bacterium GR16-43]